MTDSFQEPRKFKILAVTLVVFILVGVIFALFKLKQTRSVPQSSSEPLTSEPQKEEACIKKETGEEMNFSEAEAIALGSKCAEEGSLKEESFCNQDTGTWWLDLEVEKEGCNPACVVNVVTKEAEINWRCTGLIP